MPRDSLNVHYTFVWISDPSAELQDSGGALMIVKPSRGGCSSSAGAIRCNAPGIPDIYGNPGILESVTYRAGRGISWGLVEISEELLDRKVDVLTSASLHPALR